MKVQFSVVLALTLWLIGGAAVADVRTDHARLLETELNKLDFFNLKHWSFTQTIVEDGDTIVAKYDPTRASKQRWSLVSRNGQAANYDQMLDFRKQQQKQERDHRERLEDALEDGRPVEDGLVELIDWNSLVVIDKTEKHTTLSFQPRINRFDEDEQAHLIGVATVDNINQNILSLQVMNRDIEGTGVEFPLESFLLKVDFTYINGSILLKNKMTLVREPSSLFGGGEERNELKYSDYKSIH